MHVFLHKCLILVEATGLEPTTFWSLTKRATKLRYASIFAVRHPNSITIIPILSLLVKHFFTHFQTFSKKFLRVSHSARFHALLQFYS